VDDLPQALAPLLSAGKKLADFLGWYQVDAGGGGGQCGNVGQ